MNRSIMIRYQIRASMKRCQQLDQAKPRNRVVSWLGRLLLAWRGCDVYTVYIYIYTPSKLHKELCMMELVDAVKSTIILVGNDHGIQVFPPGWQNHKCHKFPGTPGSGGSSSLPVVQGGGDYLDAQCYVRPHSGAAVSISVPGWRVNGCQRSAGTLWANIMDNMDENRTHVLGDKNP